MMVRALRSLLVSEPGEGALNLTESLVFRTCPRRELRSQEHRQAVMPVTIDWWSSFAARRFVARKTHQLVCLSKKHLPKELLPRTLSHSPRDRQPWSAGFQQIKLRRPVMHRAPRPSPRSLWLAIALEQWPGSQRLTLSGRTGSSRWHSNEVQCRHRVIQPPDRQACLEQQRRRW